MTPGLILAAPASGQGKTTVVCAVAAALRARGLDVRTFKAGPDYLDPTWHTAVTGRPSRNLDAWMTGADGVRATYARGAEGGDIAIIEGMMGLFDGREPRGLEGSAAELALLLELPVVLAVDASGMARSAAAVVAGFAAHVPGVAVTGAIFNRAGSAGHLKLLAQAMEAVPGVTPLGGLVADPALHIAERHLGLRGAQEGLPAGWIDALVSAAEANLALDALCALARPARAAAAPMRAEAPMVRLGLAQDEAFHFYYEDNLDLLRAAGAEIVTFSPLHDAALPAVDGLYIGGGYPELHAEALAANGSMRAAIRAFRGPVYAECGGLMYLGQHLDGYEMAGALPLATRLGPRLRALGYREVRTTRDCLLGPAGTVFRGHAFHYSELCGPPGCASAYVAAGWGGQEAEGWTHGRVLASYVHAHFGSNPALARALVAACAASKQAGGDA